MTATRIVVGFDDTPSGFDAIALGRRLAEAIGAELVVAHIYPPVTITAADVAFAPETGAITRAEAESRLEHARPALEGFDAWRGVVRAAKPPARGLHEVAEDVEARLLVVGSTHRHGPGRIVPGTTADKLLHGSGFPIAVAPAAWVERSPSALRVVGAGYDGSPESGEALAAAAAVASVSGAELRAIAAFEAPNPANPLFAVTTHGYREICADLRAMLARKLDEALKWTPFVDVVAHGEVVDGNVTEVLAERSGGLDLLVVGSRGWGALRTVMLGTHTRELMSRSRCPLLVVPRGAGDPLAALPTARRHAGAH